MADEYPFLFFGAGDAKFYESLSLFIEFEEPPNDTLRSDIDQTIPTTWQDEVEWPETNVLAVHAEWARQSIAEDFPDESQTDDTITDRQRLLFHAATELWLCEVHDIAPIRSVFRDEDTQSGGTVFSEWANWSLDRVNDWLPTQIPFDDFNRDNVPAMQRAIRVVEWELTRGEIPHQPSLKWILANDPEVRDQVFRHSKGGLDPSIFDAFNRLAKQADAPQRFWDRLGFYTWYDFYQKGIMVAHARDLWWRLHDKTEVHFLAPFISALVKRDTDLFEDAMAQVPGPYNKTFETLFASAFNPVERSHLNMACRFAPTLFSDERDFPEIYLKFTECLAFHWTFENRIADADDLADRLRRAIDSQPASTVATLAARAREFTKTENWASALAIYYVIAPHKEVEKSVYCDALHVVRADTNHQPHQPEIARKLLRDCVAQSPENLDVYFNAVAVCLDMKDVDRAFELLQRLTKAAVLTDYDLKKVETEPRFSLLRDDRRWSELWDEIGSR